MNAAADHIAVAKRFANDVGSCQGCGYPQTMSNSRYPDDAVVYAIGFWPTPNNGREFRLCSRCADELGLQLDETRFTAAQHTTSLAASKPQGVIARKAQTKRTTKPVPQPQRVHVTPARKRKPRKYAAKGRTELTVTVEDVIAYCEGERARLGREYDEGDLPIEDYVHETGALGRVLSFITERQQ